ncbi:hypothetical protein EE612_012154 [Oryza sativa]|nr:hypothetical protein EE612_012154 [Oryza sativa]
MGAEKKGQWHQGRRCKPEGRSRSRGPAQPVSWSKSSPSDSSTLSASSSSASASYSSLTSPVGLPMITRLLLVLRISFSWKGRESPDKGRC